MSRHALTKRILTIQHLTTILATRSAAIEAAMVAVAADGYGGGGEGGSSDDTPIEAAVLAREQVTAHWAEFVNSLDRMIDSANRALNIGDKYLKAEGAAPEVRCDGAGDQTWGDPMCMRHAVRRITHDGRTYELCWACIKRRQREQSKGAA